MAVYSDNWTVDQTDTRSVDRSAAMWADDLVANLADQRDSKSADL